MKLLHTPCRSFSDSHVLPLQQVACRQANDGKNLLTVAVAPHQVRDICTARGHMGNPIMCDQRCVPSLHHQVYGPRDMLFLHNILSAGNKVRIFGTGKNMCSFTHVDNYCHGLIIAERALTPGSPACGGFYIVTDGAPQPFWPSVDRALQAVGCRSVFAKARLPSWFILPLAYLVACVGALMGRKLKLNPFAARMLMIHRWFNIDSAKRDLGYEPLIDFEKGWADTCTWFATVWEPKYGPNRDKKKAAAGGSKRR